MKVYHLRFRVDYGSAQERVVGSYDPTTQELWFVLENSEPAGWTVYRRLLPGMRLARPLENAESSHQPFGAEQYGEHAQNNRHQRILPVRAAP